MTAGGGSAYRRLFQRPDAAAAYLRTYAGDGPSADRLAWEFERRYLVRLLRRTVAGRTRWRALDYACGGGRVLRELAGCGAEAHGWDSSVVMLRESRRAAPEAVLRRVDLSEQDCPDVQPFDVITVFRLVLNLEPEHRALVLRRLAGLLAGSGLLLLDNHGNRASLRHLAVGLGARRRHRFANELSDREVRDLLAGAGLRLLRRAGFGWMPEFLHRHRASAPLARRIDAFLLARTQSPWLAIRVLYLAGPDRARPDRAGPDRAGPDRAGPDRAGPDRAGPDRAGPDRAGPDR